MDRPDRIAQDPPASVDAQFLLVYDKLRAIARQKLNAGRVGDSIQATGLVHEAWLKLQRGDIDVGDEDRFYATAAQAMRWILVDRARRRLAGKRRHLSSSVSVDSLPSDDSPPGFVLELDRALSSLEALDPRKAEIVMLRHFSGLTIEKTAQAMAISPATVKREWAFARAWISQQLEES